MADDTIYIDADEEITAVIDKLRQESATTISIVVPKGAALLQSVVNLKLLKKEADEHGKDIALVTADPIGRNLAAQVGIAVYEDTERKELITPPASATRPPAEEVVEVDMSRGREEEAPVSVHHYQGAKKEPAVRPFPLTGPRPPGSKRRGVIIGITIFAIAILGLGILYPKTTVVLGVKSDPYEANIELTIDKKVSEVNKNSSILPGTEIVIDKEKVTTATATGKKTVGETTKGTVTVSNCYQSIPLGLAKGKVLTSGGKSFVTSADITIPAATIVGSNCTPGQANVDIEASAVGADSNLAANSTFCVAGYSCSGSSYVEAKNSAALQGGSSQDLTILKQEDIDAASNTAKDELMRTGLDDLKSQAQTKGLRILDAAVDQQVTDKTSDKAVGTQTSDAQVTTKVRIKTLAFEEITYRQLVVDLLTLRLPEGKRLILSGNDEIATTVAEANWDQGFVKISGNVKTHAADEIDEGRVKQMVQNKSTSAARGALGVLPGVVDISVVSVPGFLGRTALLTRNISVITQAK